MHSDFSLNKGRTYYYSLNVLTIIFRPDWVDPHQIFLVIKERLIIIL